MNKTGLWWTLIMGCLMVSPASWAQRYPFSQVWAYLMQGEETSLTGREPITDLCLFGVSLDDMGRIETSIKRPNLPLGPIPRRLHLVISAPFNPSLMYFCLRRDEATRAGLIHDIVGLARGFDGIQIDFEAIRPQEETAYLAFLGQLKQQLGPEKILSVAVPARTHAQSGAYNYTAISARVDKVLVMAYDEHWRTGKPGPIASAQWCERVVDYARRTINPHKLVMGIPLYGRVWQQETVARALTYPETLQLWRQVAKPVVKRGSDQTPSFTYQTTVHASVYFEDLQSLSRKLALYQKKNIAAVGFWRIGQGPAALWDRIRVR